MANLPPGVTQAMIDDHAGAGIVSHCDYPPCSEAIPDGGGIDTLLGVFCGRDCLSWYVADYHDEVVDKVM